MEYLERRIASALGSLGKRSASEAAPNTQEAPGNKKPNKRLVFRPWDQKELHRRLETYRPLTWFAKPDAANAVACASRGWINESRDCLCCEFCSVKLLYPQSRTFEERARAVSLFAEQLSERHASHCPWRSTCCDDTVLAFDPSSPANASQARTPGPTDTLRTAFLARVSHLEQVDSLPDVFPRALEQLLAQAASSLLNADRPHRGRAWGPDSLRAALGLPAPPPLPNGAATPSATFSPGSSAAVPAKLTKGQKARLLALLGWDAEELPAGSADRPKHAAAAVYRPSKGAYSLAHLVGATSPTAPQQQQQEEEKPCWSMDNVALTCQCCKSRVGLWNFLPPMPAGTPAPPSPGTASAAQPSLPTSPPRSGSLAAQAGGPVPPTATVALASTIAGGSYTAGGFGGFGPGSGSSVGVFGRPWVASMPVYGLQALAAQHQATLAPAQPAVEAQAATGAAGQKRKHDSGPSVDSVAGTNGADGGKRPRLSGAGSMGPPAERQLFDPLQHHRLWCPWIFTGTRHASTASTPPPTLSTSAAPVQPQATPKSAGPTKLSGPSTAAALLTPQAASNHALVPTTPVTAGGQAVASGPRIRCGWMHLLDSLAQEAATAAAASEAEAAGPAAPSPAGGLFSPASGQAGLAAGQAARADAAAVVGVAGGLTAADGANDDAPPRDMARVKAGIIAALRGI